MAYNETAHKLAKATKARANYGEVNGPRESDVEMSDEAGGSSSASGGGRAGFDEEALESIERRYSTSLIPYILHIVTVWEC